MRSIQSKVAVGAVWLFVLAGTYGQTHAQQVPQYPPVKPLPKDNVPDPEILPFKLDAPPVTTPERPWIHRYDQTLVLKMEMALKKAGGGTNVLLDFDQGIEVLKKIDNLTLGIPKIVYVVGWQYDGHDSKYPAFFAVNEGLRRPQDATALDSMKWFMKEAEKYHTTVSVHINMRDAYENSPLWKTYVEHDLIQRGSNGQLAKGSVWGGEQSYRVCYTKEWNAGYTQKRIDELLKLLPIEKAGTVHIDAFLTSECAGQGITLDEEIATQRKIYRYFRDHNVDVTGEFKGDYRTDWPWLVGLQPMTWWFSESIEEYMQRPASLITGGEAVDDLHRKISLGGKLFGSSMHGEVEISKDRENLKDFLREFCLNTVPWYFLNQHERLGVQVTPQVSTASFSGEVTSRVDLEGRIYITQQGRLLRDSEDILIPAAWISDRSLIAYSEEGYQKKIWELPPEWKQLRKVNVAEVTLSGLKALPPLSVVDGKITLSLKRDQALLLTASD